MLAGRLSRHVTLPWRGLSITFAFLLLILAMRVYIARFERLFDDHTIFGGVTYTDAHVTLAGMLVVCIALVLGAMIAAANAMRVPRGRWLVAAILPAVVCYIAVQAVSWGGGCDVNRNLAPSNSRKRLGPWLHDGKMLQSFYGCVVVDSAIQLIQSGSRDATFAHQETTFGGKRPHLYGCVKSMLSEDIFCYAV